MPVCVCMQGPYSITTSRPVAVDPIAAEFLSAAVQAGLPLVGDFNAPPLKEGGGSRVGVGYYDFNIDGGVRDSAAARFLGPLFPPSMLRDPSKSNVYKAGGLTLALHAVAQTVLLQSTGGGSGPPRAVGVEYIQDGVPQRAYLDMASRGGVTVKDSFSVIVSAGALLTPKLLLRSGIGPSEELIKAGVSVKKHLPMVGKNLQDHPVVGMTLGVDPALAAGVYQ